MNAIAIAEQFLEDTDPDSREVLWSFFVGAHARMGTSARVAVLTKGGMVKCIRRHWVGVGSDRKYTCVFGEHMWSLEMMAELLTAHLHVRLYHTVHRLV